MEVEIDVTIRIMRSLLKEPEEPRASCAGPLLSVLLFRLLILHGSNTQEISLILTILHSLNVTISKNRQALLELSVASWQITL